MLDNSYKSIRESLSKKNEALSLVDYSQLDERYQAGVKEMCRLYDNQPIPNKVTVNTDAKYVAFTLKGNGLYDETKKYKNENDGLIAMFRRKADAETAKRALEASFSTKYLDNGVFPTSAAVATGKFNVKLDEVSIHIPM